MKKWGVIGGWVCRSWKNRRGQLLKSFEQPTHPPSTPTKGRVRRRRLKHLTQAEQHTETAAKRPLMDSHQPRKQTKELLITYINQHSNVHRAKQAKHGSRLVSGHDDLNTERKKFKPTSKSLRPRFLQAQERLHQQQFAAI